MSFTLARPPLVLLALVASLPFAGGGGCGSRTACFQYTQAEFDQMSSCPAQKDALANFSDPACPGPIVSVDGPGTFDGQICCYPVTYEDITPDCGNTTGAGGAGTGAFPGVTTGSGITTTMCAPSCSFSITADDSPPCGSPAALDAWMSVQGCACGGATCASNCVSFCQGAGLDASCTSCMQADCPDALNNCMAN